MGDPSPTDVITFTGMPPDEAGEICVNVPYAQSSARHYRTTWAQELRLYYTHGWLHLAGFEDKKRFQRLRMRKAEKEMLAYLSRQLSRNAA